MDRAEASRQLRDHAAEVRRAAFTVTNEHVRYGLTVAGPTVGGWLRLTGVVSRNRPLSSLALELKEIVDFETAGHLRVVSYRYTVLLGPEGPEVFAYHLHGPPVSWPHFHLGPGSSDLGDEVRQAHFPSRIEGPDPIIAMLIRDFHVRPRRRDWEQVLEGK